MLKTLFKSLPFKLQNGLFEIYRGSVYKEDLIEFINLAAALIQKEKAGSFHRAFRIILEHKSLSPTFLMIIEEMIKILEEGETLNFALRYVLGSDEFELKCLEEALVERQHIDVSSFPDRTDEPVHFWKDDEESKLIQLIAKILIRASQESCSEIEIDWQNKDEPSGVYMFRSGERFQVYDLPASLTEPIFFIILGLADLPYWEKQQNEGKFKLNIGDFSFRCCIKSFPESQIFIKLL